MWRDSCAVVDLGFWKLSVAKSRCFRKSCSSSLALAFCTNYTKDSRIWNVLVILWIHCEIPVASVTNRPRFIASVSHTWSWRGVYTARPSISRVLESNRTRRVSTWWSSNCNFKSHTCFAILNWTAPSVKPVDCVSTLTAWPFVWTICTCKYPIASLHPPLSVMGWKPPYRWYTRFVPVCPHSAHFQCKLSVFTAWSHQTHRHQAQKAWCTKKHKRQAFRWLCDTGMRSARLSDCVLPPALGLIEWTWTQYVKLGITIRDPPPESERRTHYCILLIRVDLHSVTCLKTCHSTAYFTSLWTSISVSIMMLILHVTLSRFCLYLLTRTVLWWHTLGSWLSRAARQAANIGIQGKATPPAKGSKDLRWSCHGGVWRWQRPRQP